MTNTVWIRFCKHRGAAASAALVALLGACGDQGPAESNRSLLVGQWGTDVVELVAIRAGAELRWRCSTVIVDNPIELNGDGTFTAAGRLQTSSKILGSLPKTSFRGQLLGEHVSLTLPEAVAGQSTTVELEAGISPSPLTVPECPL